MIELNNLRWEISAKIIVEGRQKLFLRRGETEQLISELEKFTDPTEKLEAMMLLNYILMGKKVKLEKGKILLFSQILPKGKVEESWTISKNPKLYSLVAKLI